ncbi:FAD-dependent oxidoreductase [Nocardia brasiliensis]|uniref:L-aspartate oxidase n=1 Tax=Nocardia brasiliensis (strain ATCC 700358 / HUJEG-1) TaxID=1133849 RepID=K0F6T4_NOCB7|nr:FAD-binding protein [Nocardia brasiliensis]AFU05080.1 putative L-aspartate oxidase (LASPO) (Quinolinate synthetase B) [Nocardia brasiliensis ATCC 700358]OCF85313.1 pyridine nucleotide-disulfide oxidoreductase [Nocardia brasiliensis]
MTQLETDVLVLGGGPAGTWAAVSAAANGARVVLADKARCGTSGPTAHGTTSLWNIPPGPARDEAVDRGYAHGGGLGDPAWMHRVLDETHHRVEQLAGWGYRFPGPGPGSALRVYLDGASYLRRMRRSVLAAGVRVLDHHPALQLLVDREGRVAGAVGVQQLDRYRTWTVRAGAVVVATGGCAFLSGGAGTDVDTGDGLLFAAEAGAELSGMEFSSAYGLVPARQGAGPANSGGLALHFATYYDESGAVLEGHRAAAFAAIADGRRVFAALDEVPALLRGGLAKLGLVDHAGRVPLRAVLEGTVRGTGGLRIAGRECATTVDGLFAAGDVTTREPITGAVSGFGGQGGAWAIASGVWAGAGAAAYARTAERDAPVREVPGAGLNAVARIDPRAVVGLVQEHTLPLRRSYWRSAGSLRDSIGELDSMWPGAEFDLGGTGLDRLRARQAAALLAVARWTKYSALARTETRGMHRRTDHPGVEADWRVRLTSGGLDTVWVRPHTHEPAPSTAHEAVPVPAAREPLARGRRDVAVISTQDDGLVLAHPREPGMLTARSAAIPDAPEIVPEPAPIQAAVQLTTPSR